MKKYILNIEPLFYLLTASSETMMGVDAQPHFDEFGFPYIPGRTFKGLLNESMQEMLESDGCDEKEIKENLEYFFGIGGRTTSELGRVNPGNFYLKNYEESIFPHLYQHPSEKYEYQNYFTIKISKTAINDDGVAQDKSLRTYAVLDNFKTPLFQSFFEAALPSEKIVILEDALLNLRHIGQDRNRDLGLVKCFLEDVDSSEEPQSVEINPLTENERIRISIKLIQPVIIDEYTGEEFSIYTKDEIDGNKILGLFANEYLKKKEGIDDTFYNFFTKGKISFGFLRKNGSRVIPKCIHFNKYDKTEIVNILNSSLTSSKPLNGYYQNGKVVKIDKTSNFHNSRPDRVAGRAYKENGDIFIYEALIKGQTFEGYIECKDLELLNEFYSEFLTLTSGRLGTSKGTQYGDIEIQLSAETFNESSNQDKLEYLVLETPAILLDKNGSIDLSLANLQENIKGLKIDTKNVYSRNIAINSFRGDWGTQKDSLVALDSGSVFKLNTVPDNLPEYIGAFNEMGYGKVAFYSEKRMEDLIAQLNTPSLPNESETNPKDPIQIPVELQRIRDQIEIENKANLVILEATKDALLDKYKSLNSFSGSRVSAIGRLLANCESPEDFSDIMKVQSDEIIKSVRDANLEKLIGKSKEKFPLYWVEYLAQRNRINKATSS